MKHIRYTVAEIQNQFGHIVDESIAAVQEDGTADEYISLHNETTESLRAGSDSLARLAKLIKGDGK